MGKGLWILNGSEHDRAIYLEAQNDRAFWRGRYGQYALSGPNATIVTKGTPREAYWGGWIIDVIMMFCFKSV